MSIELLLFITFIICIVIAMVGEVVKGHRVRRANEEMRELVKQNPYLKGEIILFDGMTYKELTLVDISPLSNKMRIRLAQILIDIKDCEEAEMPWVVRNGHVKTWTY